MRRRRGGGGSELRDAVAGALRSDAEFYAELCGRLGFDDLACAEENTFTTAARWMAAAADAVDAGAPVVVSVAWLAASVGPVSTARLLGRATAGGDHVRIDPSGDVAAAGDVDALPDHVVRGP